MSEVSTKNRFHLDEYNITNYCPNTLKAFNKENNKFILFKDKLDFFHSIEEIYETDLNDFVSFISYSILMNCIKNNKNINLLESYFYNVISSFSKVKEFKIETKTIAKYWISLITSYNTIINLSSNPSISSIDINKLHFISLKHINVSSKNNSNYYFNIPLVFNFENYIDVVLILPDSNTPFQLKTIYKVLIKYYGNKLKNIHLIKIKAETRYQVFNISNTMVSMVMKQFNKEYIDFNLINVYNCLTCALKCSPQEIYQTRYEVIPFSSNKRRILIHNV